MTKEDFLCVLKLGDKFMLRSAIVWALQHLNACKPPLDDFERLEVAMNFGILAWIRPISKSFLRNLTLKDITHDHMWTTTRLALFAITKALARLDNERRIIACRPPTLANSDASAYCPTHERCIQSLDDTWCKVFVPQFIHPDQPIALENAVAHIQSLKFGGMTASCKKRLVAFMTEVKGFTRGLEVIEDQLVRDLKMASLHMPLIEEDDKEALALP